MRGAAAQKGPSGPVLGAMEEGQQVLHVRVQGHPVLEHALQELLWVPPAFCCPVCREIMVDPFLAEDGWSYERQAIEGWLQRRAVSPMSNLEMGLRLRENSTLRQAIEQYVEATGSPEALEAFRRLQQEAHEQKGGFAFDGQIYRGALRFLPCRPQNPAPFDVDRGRLRFLNRGELWSEREFDIASTPIQLTLTLAFGARPDKPEFIVAFSQNRRCWDEGSCDALTVAVLQNATDMEPVQVWVRTKMFAEEIAFGPLPGVAYPPADAVGKVVMELSTRSLSLNVFGHQTRRFNVRGKVEQKVHFGFVGFHDHDSCDVVDVKVG